MLKSKCQTVLISIQGNNYNQKSLDMKKCKKVSQTIFLFRPFCFGKLKLFNHSEKERKHYKYSLCHKHFLPEIKIVSRFQLFNNLNE